MPELICPSTCGKPFDTERKLLNHLASDELLSGRALTDAIKKVREGSTDPHLKPVETNGLNGDYHVSQPTEAVVMPTHPNKANPEACKHCAQRAPDKCPRHGGKKLRQKNVQSCGYCHRTAPAHTPNCPKNPAIRAVAAGNGQTTGARAAAMAYAGELRKIVERLNDEIRRVEKVAGAL